MGERGAHLRLSMIVVAVVTFFIRIFSVSSGKIDLFLHLFPNRFAAGDNFFPQRMTYEKWIHRSSMSFHVLSRAGMILLEEK